MVFKVGDRVIGNAKANERYCITSEGWVGYVVKKLLKGYMVVSEYKGDPATFKVMQECFDLYHETKITITTDGKTTVATLYENGRPKKSATAKCSPDDEFNFLTGAKLAMERLDKKINPIMVGGFKVGDRVNRKGMNGTIICIDNDDVTMIGVMFDEENRSLYGHRCTSIKLKDGKSGTKAGRYYKWCDPDELKHGEVPYYNGKVVCVDNCGYNFMTKGKIYQFVDGHLTYDNGDENETLIRNFDHWVERSAAKWVELVE